MASRNILLALFLMNYGREAFTQNITNVDFKNISVLPAGCDQELNFIYYGLCNLSAVWGIILEALAGLGMLCTFFLAIIFCIFAPSVIKDVRKGCLAINFMFIIGVFGLFSLAFAFIVAPDNVICSVRKFLFGVLFSMCFSCLIAHSVRLNYLAFNQQGPGGCVVFALAIGLFMVEGIINLEWVLITDMHKNFQNTDPIGTQCLFSNQDFVTALVYVMLLICVSLLLSCPVLYGIHIHWKRHGKYIVVTTCFSVAIWVAWIVMYTYGNEALGYGKSWDDPVLAITLTSSGWVFLIFYIIPELVEMRRAANHFEVEDHTMDRIVECPPAFFENKAFSMENPEVPTAPNQHDRPTSPYSGYNGLYPTLPLYPLDMETVNHISIPRVTMDSWRCYQ